MQGNGRFAAAILSPKQRLHIEVACYDRAKPRDEWVSTELKDLASLMLPAFLKARIVKLRYAQHSTIN